MKKLLILLVSLMGLLFLAGDTAYCQCPDTSDVGNCDTLWIEREPGRIPQGTTVVRTIKCYWDEQVAGGTVPIKYKNPQTDVFLDSMKLTSFSSFGITSDTVINHNAGTIILFWIGITGGSMPAGTYTMATMYFRTGTTSWDPATHNPIDTFTIGGPGGQGLSYVDTSTRDIQPVYDPPGNLDVKDDQNQSAGIPKSFSLSQNYPNPFNATTVISFGLPKSSQVRLEIYNILGQKVKDLVDERVTAGYKRVVWDGKDNNGNTVSSGVYFYKLDTEEFTEVLKMTLLK